MVWWFLIDVSVDPIVSFFTVKYSPTSKPEDVFFPETLLSLPDYTVSYFTIHLSPCCGVHNVNKRDNVVIT